MTILIDIDGVVFNTQETLLNFMNTIYQTNYSFKEINHYEWLDEHFPNPWGLLEQTSFWNCVAVDQDAVKYISRWIKQGYTVKFVTATHYHQAIDFKMKKLKDSFNGLIDDKDIIVCHDKNMVRGNIIIDDCFNNAKQYGMIPNQYSILYAQPWNINQFLHEDVIGKMKCYDSWDGIDAAIKYAIKYLEQE